MARAPASADQVADRPNSSPPWVDRVAQAAVAAPIVFFTVMMVLGFVTPGYNWVARYGSELSLGPLGGVMIANFIILGLVELALAAAFVRTIASSVWGVVVAGAVGLLGAAFFVAGVCVTDPAKLITGAHTWHGIVHALMAVVIFFIATPIAALALAVGFRRQKGFAAYCLLTAVATPALLVVTFSSGDLLGLAERIVIAVVLAWLTVVALRLQRGKLLRSGRDGAGTGARPPSWTGPRDTHVGL
jgi:hypothetical membrane protein